jgi:nucleotide-sensitive chloride channel 1A
MALTVIRSSPALDSFTPLAEYQSQTPASFVVSKPVLHYHGVGATALAQQDYVSKLPIFATPEATQDAEDTAANAVASVDVFVTSE